MVLSLLGCDWSVLLDGILLQEVFCYVIGQYCENIHSLSKTNEKLDINI